MTQMVSKNNLEILEEAINTISLSKKQSISIFDNLFQINYGEQFSHYSTEQLTVVDGTKEQFIPDNIGTLTSDFERLTIIKNKVVLQRDIDYTIPADGTRILFTDTPLSTDLIVLRRYDSVKEAYIPPSSTFLKINPLYKPMFVSDTNYDNQIDFIQGRFITPKFNDRTDDILLMFETLMNSLYLSTSETGTTKRLKNN